jgi:hypothetical protein
MVKRFTPEEQLQFLKRRAVEIIPEDDLLKKLERSQRTGKTPPGQARRRSH